MAVEVGPRGYPLEKGLDRHHEQGGFPFGALGRQVAQRGQTLGDDVLVRREGIVSQGLAVGKMQQVDVRGEESKLVQPALGLPRALGDHQRQPLVGGGSAAYGKPRSTVVKFVPGDAGTHGWRRWRLEWRQLVGHQSSGRLTIAARILLGNWRFRLVSPFRRLEVVADAGAGRYAASDVLGNVSHQAANLVGKPRKIRLEFATVQARPGYMDGPAVGRMNGLPCRRKLA